MVLSPPVLPGLLEVKIKVHPPTHRIECKHFELGNQRLLNAGWEHPLFCK